MSPNRIENTDVAVVGSGRLAPDLLRILGNHPHVNITGLGSGSPDRANAELSEVLQKNQIKAAYEDLPMEELHRRAKAVFFCGRDEVTQKQAPKLAQEGILAIDLGGSFRLPPELAKKLYGTEHSEALKRAVYGLPEVFREQIKDALLIGNPGCYPTATILGAMPFIKSGIAQPRVDVTAISGKSGGGAQYAPLGTRAYGFTGHKHQPEIAHILRTATGKRKPIPVTFTPIVLENEDRGIIASLTLQPKAKGMRKDETLFRILQDRYLTEPFLDLIPPDELKREGVFSLKHVVGRNRCRIGACMQEGRIKVLSLLDNIIKGAAGQAVQNFNIRQGYDERDGLDH